MLSDALAYAQQHREQTLADLQALLRIPSISTLPEHQPDMQRAAGWLVDQLAGLGLNARQIATSGGPDVVYADWLDAGPGQPTLLVYGHYDVQPADPLDEWHTPPFEPTIEGDNMFGRGTSDNKGQFYTHIAATAAYLHAAGRLPLNIKFLLEGEEECGSPHLDEFVRAHRELLKADAAVISDTPIVDPQTPALMTGVRGLVYMEVFMRGSRRDLHSGGYGGVVENPLNAMVRLLASLHDASGRVTIPDFYDKVRLPMPAEREALENGTINSEKILAETGAPQLWGEAGYSVAERIGVRPTLDIHGIKGGFIGSGQKTVIPATASAKVSMRTVPDQDAEEIARLFTEHILRLAPPTMEVSVQKLAAADSAVIDMSAPAVEAGAQAYEQAFGRRPVYVREGGTLPVVSMFHKVLQAPVVMMGFGLPDDALHAPNEKFYLPNFYRGIETAIHYYDILSRQI